MVSIKEDLKEVREHLLDLYLDVKVRSNDELSALDDKKLADERSKLKTVASKVIIDYIRSSIEILLNLKNEDQNPSQNNHGQSHSFSQHNMSITSSQSNVMMQMNKKKNQQKNYNQISPLDSQNDYNKLLQLNQDTNKSMVSNSVNQTTSHMGYEEQMQQYEADIRNHISIEQQLKIYIDNIKYKMECDEKEFIKKEEHFNEQILQLQKDKARLDELVGLKDKDMSQFKDEIKLLKEQIGNFEIRNEKLRKETITITESKFKTQMSQMQEELDRYKTAYQTSQLSRQYSNSTTQIPFNNQNDGQNPLINQNNNNYQYQTNVDANSIQLVNFYANDDEKLINIENKPNISGSGHKKNQLSLQSNKSIGKIMTSGYNHTLSTHQSTQGVKDHNQVNQNFHHTVQNSQKYQPQIGSIIGIPSQISFTNPRNSTAFDPHSKIIASHNSIESSKGSKNKTMIKNHSEYFVTNPHVKEIVESSQKSFRNKAAQLLTSQNVVGKKTSIHKSPDKNLTKTSLYKMTMQKSSEKLQPSSLHSNKRLSNKPSRERNQLQQSTQMSQASFNQSINNSATGQHRRSKTGLINSFAGISNTVAQNSFRPTVNNSYQRSRENSQTNNNNNRSGINSQAQNAVLAMSMMPANNQAQTYSFLKHSQGQSRTIQGPIAATFNVNSLQTYSIDNYEIQDDNTHKIPNTNQQKDQNHHFKNQFEDHDEKYQKEQRGLDGGTQHIKSMKNLKTTIQGNYQNVKQPSSKFKINEKDIQYRNSQIQEAQQFDQFKKMQSQYAAQQSQRSSQGLTTSVLSFTNSLTGTQPFNIPTQNITINHNNNNAKHL